MIIITNTIPFVDAKAFAAAVNVARKANRGKWICFHGALKNKEAPLDVTVKSFDLWPQLVTSGSIRRGCNSGISTVTGFCVAIASAITEIQLSLEMREGVNAKANASASAVLGKKENNSVILPGV